VNFLILLLRQSNAGILHQQTRYRRLLLPNRPRHGRQRKIDVDSEIGLPRSAVKHQAMKSDSQHDTSATSRIVPMSVGVDGISLAYDGIRDDPKYADILKEAEQFAWAEKTRLGRPTIHSTYFLDITKKRYLKEKYGIDWLTTHECNPAVEDI
jgi:hypothetical protein